LQGNGQSGFWLFNHDANSWSALPNVPASVGSGGGVSTENYDTGFFMTFAGGGSRQVNCFSNISDGTWTQHSDFPGGVGVGGADAAQPDVADPAFPAGVPGGGYVFAFQGSGLTTFYKTSTLTQTCSLPPSPAVPEFPLGLPALFAILVLALLVLRKNLGSKMTLVS
jgi:hypothetical protein